MPFEVISSDTFGPYTVDANDSVVLLQGVNLTSSGDGLSGANDEAMYFSIQGHVIANGGGAILGQTATDTSTLEFNVGETGMVTSLTGFGAFIRRDFSSSRIDGEVNGNTAGIYYQTNVEQAWLNITGKVTAKPFGPSNYGVNMDGDASNTSAGRLDLNNSGLISGGTGLRVANESLRLINTGTIQGNTQAIEFEFDSDADNVLNVRNFGTIEGLGGNAITSDGSRDFVYNYGTIIGSVSLGSGNNTLENYGTMQAGFFGAGADIVTNQGLMTTVNLSSGNDRYWGFGGDIGRVDAGAGNDTIEAEGTDLVVDGGADTDQATLRSSATVNNVELIFVEGSGLVIDAFTTGGVDMRDGIGSNQLSGFSGNDTISGGRGEDVIDGKGGNDRLDGGGHGDLLLGGDGFDTLRGESGRDELYGGDDRDLLLGGGGRDTVFGENGSDTIKGGTGDDLLFGQNGNDKIKGGGGDDTIIGGNGQDELIGGSGIDHFIFENESETKVNNADTIVDFQRGEDRVDLSEIGDGAFLFLGTSAFSAGGDLELRYVVGGSGVELELDIDGDGSADAKVNFSGLSTLTADDFIL